MTTPLPTSTEPTPPVNSTPDTSQVATDEDAWLAAAQADARYSILEPSPLQQNNPYPNTSPIAPPGTGGGTPLPGTGGEPAPAAPAPAPTTG